MSKLFESKSCTNCIHLSLDDQSIATSYRCNAQITPLYKTSLVCEKFEGANHLANIYTEHKENQKEKAIKAYFLGVDVGEAARDLKLCESANSTVIVEYKKLRHVMKETSETFRAFIRENYGE